MVTQLPLARFYVKFARSARSDTFGPICGVGGSTSTSSAPKSNSTNSGPYKLVQDWTGNGFFDGWEFWDLPDPTHVSQVPAQKKGTTPSNRRFSTRLGIRLAEISLSPIPDREANVLSDIVNYLSQDAAKSANLISTTTETAIMRVDNTTKLDAGKSRDSIRIHSKAPMKIGSIVIADIIAMPFGCATWPAWWTNGPDWPKGGEIDIIEGVNNQPENSITLHTADSNCKQDLSVDITGEPIKENNDCNANVQSNQGCSFREVADASYGEPFNKKGGGVLVTSFTKESIDVWFWSRADIPDNIQKGSPDRSTWGKPTASWLSKSCDIEKYFADHGDWAGADMVRKRDCGDKAPTCLDYLADPSHFSDAYWEIGYIRVYEIG
ncbi:glycoside hydrolase family 16 protein [Sporobolomyces koalae]|uniref:glycoside hydrolase family 16 protein n=1 Tax=Sporobolomyces koalae TaxID=500713 RepID=UPI0031774A29